MPCSSSSGRKNVIQGNVTASKTALPSLKLVYSTHRTHKMEQSDLYITKETILRISQVVLLIQYQERFPSIT